MDALSRIPTLLYWTVVQYRPDRGWPPKALGLPLYR